MIRIYVFLCWIIFNSLESAIEFIITPFQHSKWYSYSKMLKEFQESGEII